MIEILNSSRYKDVKNDHFGLSSFLWRVRDTSQINETSAKSLPSKAEFAPAERLVCYHVLRTGCFPYIKYYCTRVDSIDLLRTSGRQKHFAEGELERCADDRFFLCLKLLNLGTRLRVLSPLLCTLHPALCTLHSAHPCALILCPTVPPPLPHSTIYTQHCTALHSLGLLHVRLHLHLHLRVLCACRSAHRRLRHRRMAPHPARRLAARSTCLLRPRATCRPPHPRLLPHSRNMVI